MATGVLLALAPGAAAAPWQAIVPDAGDSSSRVTPIDLLTNVAGPSLTTPGGQSALGVAITPDARTAYVLNAGSQSLTAVDLTTSPPRVHAAISLTTPGVQRGAIYIAITPDGRAAYTSDTANNVVLPIDLTAHRPTVGTPIKVGKGPAQLAVTPDGRTLYVVDAAGNAVTPINVRTGRPGAAITGVSAGQGGIAITPDGRRALVASNRRPEVLPITLATRKVGPPIALPAVPLGIAVTPDGTRAYTANFGEASHFGGTGSTVTPIDLATDTALPSITVGSGPWAIAITPDGRTAYSSNSNAGTVTPIDIATNTTGPAIPGVPAGRSIAITPDQPPVPRFTVASGAPGTPSTFDASASTIRFNAITGYTWDFGDGTPTVHTTGPTVTHTYSQVGLRHATVTETGAGGVPGAATDTFVVGTSAVAPPVVGKTVLVARSTGTVLVRRRGSRRFVALKATTDVPTGSELDTRRGTATITVARDRSQQTDTATVSGGRFVTTQTLGATPATTFALSQHLSGCVNAHAARARSAIARKRKPGSSRQIEVHETGGHFGTKGRYVAASVQGTRWTTQDTCTSSTVSVADGVVRVRDLVHHTTRSLGAGQRYTAHKR